MTRKEAIETAIRSGLNAMDFCGSVSRAIAAVQDDLDIEFTPDEKQEIRTRILEAWNKSKQEAKGTK